jgi:2-hydroxy-6-oxonona-2,4-dienedioate hydrolase
VRQSLALSGGLAAAAATWWWARRTFRAVRAPGVLRVTTVAVGAHRIRALAGGASGRGAVPVVLVHGWGVAGSYLVPTAARLAASHPVRVPDLPGHGESSKPRDALDVRGLADALIGWLDAAGLGGAVLLGNSLGCQTITDVALRRPDLVRGLVLVGPTVDPRARSVPRLAARLLACAVFDSKSLAFVLARDFARMGLRRLRAELYHMLDDRIERRLPRVRVPVLVVRGERDAIAPPRWVGEMARLLGGRGRLITIRGAAHAPSYSHPDELARGVRAFLSELDAAGPGSQVP